MDNRPKFGEKGKIGVVYTGDLPYEHRGSCTSVNYVWNQRRNNIWVDKRDLPELVKAAGRDKLMGNLDNGEETPKAKPKRKPKTTKQPKLGQMRYGETEQQEVTENE